MINIAYLTTKRKQLPTSSQSKFYIYGSIHLNFPSDLIHDQSLQANHQKSAHTA